MGLGEMPTGVDCGQEAWARWLELGAVRPPERHRQYAGTRAVLTPNYNPITILSNLY